MSLLLLCLCLIFFYQTGANRLNLLILSLFLLCGDKLALMRHCVLKRYPNIVSFLIINCGLLSHCIIGASIVREQDPVPGGWMAAK